MLKRNLLRYGHLDKVRKRYLGFSASLFIVFTIIVSGIFIGRVYSLGNIYAKNTRNEIVNIKKDLLKDTVTNTISAVEKIRVRQEDLLKSNISRTIAHLNINPDFGIHEIINYISQDENMKLLDIVIEDEAGNVVFSSPEGLTSTDILPREKASEFFQEYQHGEYSISFMVLRDTVKKQVEEELRAKIYREIYFQDAYMWVNEILDYSGGDDYAVRLIHPNLKETEGMMLSTSMEDNAGNHPYKEELEGINKDGELYFTYNFKKLADDEISEKITYAKIYKDYNWVLAMGIHYDRIDTYCENARYASKNDITSSIVIVMGAGILTLLAGLGIFLILEEKYFIMSNKVLKEELATDELTGAKSRRAGMVRLKEKFYDYTIKNGVCALLMLDLDDFKLINDTYGHDVGDKVLYEVVKNIKKVIRDSDAVYRWGGEEFVILVEEIDPEGLEIFIEKILVSVKNTQISVEDKFIDITTSIGATYFKEGDKSFENVVKRADEALYESKEKGKGMGTIKL